MDELKKKTIALVVDTFYFRLLKMRQNSMKASLCIFAYELKERGSSFPGHRSITSLTTINEVSASKKNPFQNRDLQQLVGVSEWSIKRGRLRELTGMMVDANLGTQRNECWFTQQ